MKLPKLPRQGQKASREIVNTRGLNLSDNTQDGDLAGCKNLSSHRWPYLATRNKRERLADYTGVTAITSWGKLIAVEGEALLYDGKEVGKVTPGAKQFAVVNTKLVIWPDKVYLDMTTQTVKPLGAKATAAKGVFTADTVTLTGGPDLTQVFAVGDCVTLSGLETLKANNGDVVIKELAADKLTLSAKSLTEGEEENALTLERRVPDLDYICESGNRLWGCSNQEKTIFASVLGDPTNFYVYEGLSTDAYAVAVGSEGDFTGCCKLSTAVLFWKERTLHKMLGDYPAEYALFDYAIDGLRAGCSRSMQILNDVLLYVGVHGVYTYAGGTPSNIAACFGSHSLEEGVAGTDGERYYLSALLDGQAALLVYDPRLGVWMQEDETRCVDFARMGQEVYFLTQAGEVWQADSRQPDPEAEWEAVYTPFYETIQGRKRYSRLVLRVELAQGAWLTAYTRTDGGPWQEAAKRIGGLSDAAALSLRPNRGDKFELRLRGKGPCAILSVLREFTVGGEG